MLGSHGVWSSTAAGRRIRGLKPQTADSNVLAGLTDRSPLRRARKDTARLAALRLAGIRRQAALCAVVVDAALARR
jgi:hypothetical protein